MALMKCPECGKDVSDKAKVCIHCGFPLDGIEIPQDAGPEPDQETIPENLGPVISPPETEKPKKKHGVIIGVCIFVAAIAGLAYLVHYENGQFERAADDLQETQQKYDELWGKSDASETSSNDDSDGETINLWGYYERSQEKDDEEDSLTIEQKNALGTVESYLNSGSFSREGLIEQLEFEGYSEDVSTWAVDNTEIDWNEQAAKTAEQYLSSQSFSRSGLLDQLIYEGFSQEQAEYGVESVGY